MLFLLAIVLGTYFPLSSTMTNSNLNFLEKFLFDRDMKMILFSKTLAV